MKMQQDLDDFLESGNASSDSDNDEHENEAKAKKNAKDDGTRSKKQSGKSKAEMYLTQMSKNLYQVSERRKCAKWLQTLHPLLH
tara:strand:+ start:315 stop:566 length:252 start_codon:yes stop_codon:yes gene_type:complete